MIQPLDARQLRWENPTLTEWQLFEKRVELMEDKINELISWANNQKESK